MDPKRGDFVQEEPKAVSDNPMARPSRSVGGGMRPVVGTGVLEVFADIEGEIYKPYLLREATVHFSLNKADAESARKVVKVNPILEDVIDWDDTGSIDASALDEAPREGMGFGELPGYAMNAKNYKQVEDDFEDDLYREEREEVLYCAELKAWSRIAENQADFRVRLSQAAREVRDAELAKLRESLGKKVRTLEGRLRTAENRLEKEKAESSSAKVNAGISVLGGILTSIFGRKSGFGSISRTRSSSTVTKATTAYKQHRDVANAEAKIEGIEEEIEVIEKELEKGLAEITKSFDPSELALEKETIKPTRSDVRVERVGLLWK